ncbi:MAG: shikimate dehydrogenase [Clostridia bacterium]|nr:shikimate dehydrogenase [Clostridia bacterium]
MSASFRLIGHPLGHSLSPFIHKRLFALSGYPEGYDLCDIAPDDLDEQLPALLKTVKGLNVTIPHKQRVAPFLDSLATSAVTCRAVNCIAVTEDGIVGHNTDVSGFLQSLEQAAIPLQGRVLVVGAGGVGGMFAVIAAEHGCETVVYNPRHADRAVALAEEINRRSPAVPCRAATTTPEGDFDLIINATPVGMYPHGDECPLPDEVIARTKAAFDAIYNPRQTLFLQKAAASGAKTEGGMAMLVWQAVVSHEIWYNAAFDPADIAALINDCYAELARFQ